MSDIDYKTGLSNFGKLLVEFFERKAKDELYNELSDILDEILPVVNNPYQSIQYNYYEL